MFHLLAFGKLIGGDWYLASILIFESGFSFLIIIWCTSFLWQCRKNSPKLCDSTSHTVRLGRGQSRRSALSVPRHSGLARSLHSLFHVCSHVRPAGRLGKCLTLSSNLHQNISRLLYLCTCYLPVLFKIISMWFVPTPASKRSASLSVLVWHTAYFQEHDIQKKRGFKIISLQVNSGNYLCKCSSVVLSERSILTEGKELWSEEGQTAHIQLFLSHLERISPSVSVSCAFPTFMLLALDKNERSGP